MRSAFLSLLCGLALVQSACTSHQPREDAAASGPVEAAVSRQTAGSDERQRAKAHTELGRRYLFDGGFEVALDEARIAIEIESAYAPAHNLRGLVYMALRRNDLAETSFREALRLAPNDPEINNDYGWFLCRSQRSRESLAYFRVAIGNPLYQSLGTSLINAGLCAVAAKEDRQAQEYFLRALQSDRGNLTALYWLADIAYRDNRPMEARLRLKDLHAQMTEPTAASTWLALRVERKLGDRENEARLTGQLRRKHRDSEEYLKLMRGEFD